MRTFPLVAVTFAALSLSAVGAHAAPWCANYGTGPGMNCGFYSFQQCMATLSGNGGSCQHNPFSAYGSAGSAYGAAREPRRRYRRDY
jgi:hypothetical protein